MNEEKEDVKQLQRELLQGSGSNTLVAENLSRLKSFHTLDVELALQALLDADADKHT